MYLEVHFAGGDAGKMSQIFGGDFVYRPQAAGDLGERLVAVLDGARGQGAVEGVVIGSAHRLLGK